jgi:hypothetical protein
MALPVATDDEAQLFVRITHYYKSLPIMARWRAIGMDTAKPKAASMVAREVGNACRS